MLTNFCFAFGDLRSHLYPFATISVDVLIMLREINRSKLFVNVTIAKEEPQEVLFEGTVEEIQGLFRPVTS